MVIPIFCSAQQLSDFPKLLYRDTLRVAPTISLGWFKTFTDEQMEHYSMAQWHAMVYAEVNEKVKWSNGGAYGYSQVLQLEPKAGGYCKHIRTVVFAFNQKLAQTQAACHTYWDNYWSWYNIE
jgi:hypothetical protein